MSMIVDPALLDRACRLAGIPSEHVAKVGFVLAYLSGYAERSARREPTTPTEAPLGLTKRGLPRKRPGRRPRAATEPVDPPAAPPSPE